MSDEVENELENETPSEMDLIIAEIKRHYILKLVADDELAPFIEMAQLECAKYTFKTGYEIKAKAYLSLAYLGIKFWHHIQQRANEYDETLETFHDVSKWEEYWKGKFYALISSKNTEGYLYAAV